MKINKIMCKITICRQTKKKFIITKINETEKKLINLFIKINIIKWCKREYNNIYSINLNLDNKINIKTIFKNNIFLKKNNKKLIITSNDRGVNFLKNNKGGLALCLIHL